MPLSENYMSTLKERGKKSRVYAQFQDVGLTLTELLCDEKHKALYIKLAKQHDADKLLNLAKRISGMKNIKNKGAYFMKVLHSKE
ncbi:MAG: hypothetical protein NTZ36_01185 [Candidatus Jorgensenbacteria bacterium]|nr:hypothetical protein [Candidatus Jorgensenbacteria bacterium]